MTRIDDFVDISAIFATEFNVRTLETLWGKS